MKVRTNFEGGRIEVVGTSASRVTLRVPHDVGAPRFRQHFAFDLTGYEPGQPVELCIENARVCTWGDTFGGLYRVYVADERQDWNRAQTHYDGNSLRFTHVPQAARCRFAYTPPYPSERIDRLVARATDAGARWKVLARTPNGRAIGHLVFGTRHPAARELWVIAQQHPGESMAGWFVEGLVEALLPVARRVASWRGVTPMVRPLPGPVSAVAENLLARARVHIVPRMNPDGVAAGNHRTTPTGVDLNRTWNAANAPVEVAAVRAAMERTGADLLIDVHGDERLPWVFAQPADHYPGRASRIADQQRRLEAALTTASPDFQTKHRYSYDPAGHPNLQVAINWAQQRFGCLAVVLEMPFSDNADKPDARGWHPERSKALGRAFASALGAVAVPLREASLIPPPCRVIRKAGGG